MPRARRWREPRLAFGSWNTPVVESSTGLPLYRQGEILARLGADIPRSTLIDWCGQATAVLRPLADRITQSILSADRLHADDTRSGARCLASGAGQGALARSGSGSISAMTGRGAAAIRPGSAHFFSPDRQGKHQQGHLARFEGVLQADTYAGFNPL